MKKFLLLIVALVLATVCLGCQKAQQGEGEMPAPELDVQTVTEQNP